MGGQFLEGNGIGKEKFWWGMGGNEGGAGQRNGEETFRGFRGAVNLRLEASYLTVLLVVITMARGGDFINV